MIKWHRVYTYELPEDTAKYSIKHTLKEVSFVLFKQHLLRVVFYKGSGGRANNRESRLSLSSQQLGKFIRKFLK